MNLLYFLVQVKELLALPSMLIFIGVGIYLTFKTRFIQFRFFTEWKKIIFRKKKDTGIHKISAIQALYTGMATSVGMGSIVGPSVAILVGGPGALFWLLAYTFFGGASRFSEITFALNFRKKTDKGQVLGGPMQYLKTISPSLASFYAFTSLIIFAGWMAVQANTLSSTLYKSNILRWQTGLILTTIVSLVLIGKIKRVGKVLSKLVPFRIFVYLIFSSLIIIKNFYLIPHAIFLILKGAFIPTSAIGGFLGASVFTAMSEGIYKGIYISESGTGAQAIPHSMSNVENPTDQGILALSSIYAEMLICLISGLLVLVTGAWKVGYFTDTLIYEIFSFNIPYIGGFLFSTIIVMFIISTIIGQAFNGSQSFGYFTKYKGLKFYYLGTGLVIFLGAIAQVPVLWTLTDILMPFIAIPNLLGLIILSIKHPKMLKI